MTGPIGGPRKGEVMTTQTFDEAKVEALCNRLFMGTLDLMEIATVYLGDTLGLYTALVETGPITAAKFAEHTGLSERYIQEWLGQQAISGIIDSENGTTDAAARRYSISPEHAVVMTEKTSPAYIVFVGKFLKALGGVLPDLVTAFRTGEGVPYAAYGPEAVAGQAAMTLPGYVNSLANEWVPQIPGLKDRLEAGATVAEVACGAGVAAIELAKAFPKVHVDGFDLDETSIATARENAAEAGLSDRVTFHVRDARDPEFEGRYDVVTIFEALHDAGDPVPLLATLKRLVAPGGITIVVDEKVADEFTAPGDEIERFMASSSVVWCLPQGLADGAHAHGTLLRTPQLRAYAKEAGWTDVQTLPIEHMSWRFYRLVA
jgi:2-polyprenyl-3-methyl-5-hydroxy-6-metoxy-1,4-benzoquinol methylase